jgi:hypothetical protein
MTPLIKRSPLTKRIKALKKELAAVDNDLKALSKGRAKRSHDRAAQPDVEDKRGEEQVAKPARHVAISGLPAASDKVEEEVQRLGRRIHDRRFADYLSTSFQSVRPLRHERKVQRNKAILMAVLAALALFWVLYRFVV